MATPHPSRTQAEILARIHYGLPPIRTQPGDQRLYAGKRFALEQMRRAHMIDEKGLTPDGYVLLAGACAALEPPHENPAQRTRAGLRAVA